MGEKKSPYKNYRVYRSLYYGLVVLAFLVWGSVVLVSSVSSLMGHRALAQYGLCSLRSLSSQEVTRKHVTLETLRDGTFKPNFKELQWIQSPESASNDQGTYLLKDKVDSRTTYLVKSIVDENFHYKILDDAKFTYHGVDYIVESLKASPDLSKAILKTDASKGWRHSSTALYWILDVKTGDIAPLLNAHDKLSVTSWAPTSDYIAFVFKNDVYVKSLEFNTISRVTKDGSADIFNGKPDWVYEEEVFGTDIAMWWSPRGDRLSFLRFDDTLVPEFTIPYYVQPGHDEYPEVRSIKYPKPGYANPSVDVIVAQLPKTLGGAFSVHVARLPSEKISDKVVTEVLWVSEDFVMVKTTNRASDIMEVFLVSADASTGPNTLEPGAAAQLVRTQHAENSWFEVTSNAVYVPRNDLLGRYTDGYIDIVTSNGYNHLAYFTPPNNPKPMMLTEGQWEVISNHVDLLKNEVYFAATIDSSVERHFYSVNLLDVFHQQGSPAIKRITLGTSWYSGSFSLGSRFVLLNYQGPGVPHQSLVDLHDGKTVKVIEENADLRNTLEEFDLPRQVVGTINLGRDEATGGDVVANTVEIFPPSFNESRKYPVLFYVYGGPGSQMVTQEFAVGFSHVVASQLNAIVVTVDGRGTGFNNRDAKLGSAFKFCVRDRLGHFEPLDQIEAARQWARRAYVDETRMSIWGWSYGGFLTLKTLETDTDNVFSYGVAVAPVTKWKLYDSIYTERYLRTPQENAVGYETASIADVPQFSSVKRFLIMHGLGDDNVHFQNSLRLLDDYNLAGVENYDFMVFPDSDHSIRYHNGNTVVFDRIFDWLRRAFNNEFEAVVYPDHSEL
ncbi:hypothetical protein METBIDRAFT_78699 [Metschnikowia bicuspidata var. bicuspidata NRRL YB-4993]|uniref:Dipeptidyl aminopeptidase B n=1 Tax=Metschnikowia bicuspidata var. bicuspidata NRRL YB-4993 TaxID=869754 RepID=A0A1A0H8A5_9ASCO|nr:hypothetical protein METBIDRAFT_78699 [Metschnikowia bicuspidata var. bicuspidata NRRL YB-4993]OBA20256.1 hypothetical protein METBIDRAFT_78699 [Metschnikowia bicuspidata var. bicuspidata NRRL YB-4993]